MKIYLDVCCLNRPYDDQTQDRIRLESEAVITILRRIESEEWHLVSSGVLSYEISRTYDKVRKRLLYSAVRRASEFIPVGQETSVRAGDCSVGSESEHTTHFILPVQSREEWTYFCQRMTGL